MIEYNLKTHTALGKSQINATNALQLIHSAMLHLVMRLVHKKSVQCNEPAMSWSRGQRPVAASLGVQKGRSRKYITITKGDTNHQPPVFTIAIREVVGLVAGASGAEVVVVVAPFKVRTTLDVSASLERSLKSYDKERGSQDTVIHAWRGRWRKEHIMSSMTAMV